MVGMEKMNIPEFRKSSSPVVLDVEDIRILIILSENKPFMQLRELEKKLKISRKAILTHIERLKNNHWISFIRSEKDYKSKVLGISSLGIELLDLSKKSGVYVVHAHQLYLGEEVKTLLDRK